MNEASSGVHSSLFSGLPVADLGVIAIRVFVLPPKSKKADGSASSKEDDIPADLEAGEEGLIGSVASPLGSYLEHSKGKRCVVFLVNGQRQEALDNSFIVQDLGFRYLRARMMIVVDVDGLAPEAIGKLMQGSRQGFYRGDIWTAIVKRIVATLKGDPDLVRLEEEAEELVSELKAGDEKVKQALDQLINSHHDQGPHFAEGAGASGESEGSDQLGFKITKKDGVVILAPPDSGQAADYPVLLSHPAGSNIRLHPGVEREISIKSLPSQHWPAISQFNVESDPNVPELSVESKTLDSHARLTLLFTKAADSVIAYPIHANVKVTAEFNGIKDKRQLDLRFHIQPAKKEPPPILLDEPTKINVISRRPIKIRRGENDTHVRLGWDGKDRLLNRQNPAWTMVARVTSGSRDQPAMNFSEAIDGQFSVLVSPRAEWSADDKLEFEIEARGPSGRTIGTQFEAIVIDQPIKDEKIKPKPQLVEGEYKVGSNRRPPYILRVITRDEYEQPCWDASQWTDGDPGAYVAPSDRAPLTLIINQDMEELREYRRALTRKNTEQDVERKINKYTSHIAFHLYQMYLAAKDKKEEDIDGEDMRRREEIRRVSLTMIKLMEVGR